jgi:gluconate 5-dehydrogenase
MNPMSYLDALFSLNGKVALVTGSNRGIGYSLARGLARAGASVVLNGRDRERTEAAARDLKDEDLAASTSIADVTDREDVIREVSRIEEQYGAIDILVNNAGIQHRAAFVEFPEEKFDAIMRSNVYAPFFVAQAVARGMTARARGSIINICSVQSELGRPSIVPYTACKGAMKMMTKAMAAELGSSSLRVNGLAPGYFRTDLNEALTKNPAFSDWLVSRTPLGRWGEMDELVGAAILLASDASSFVTGQIIYVDGGITSAV